MIEFISRESKVGRNVFKVSIDPETKERYTAQQIVNIVDGYFDEAKADVCFNYGGCVTFISPGVYQVDVYTD